MKTEALRAAAIVLAIVPSLFSACVNDETPTVARVVVEANPAAPLELIVSTNFLTTFDEETGTREVTILTADTIQLTGDFDQEYGITQFGRIYVRVANDEATPEQVRLVVFIGAERRHNALDEVSDGEFIEFVYTSRSIA